VASKLLLRGLMAKMRKRVKAVLPTDPHESAKVAGLRYVTASGAGIVRKPMGGAFSYIGSDGKVVKDKTELERFRLLVIPPAWTDVWICPLKAGHLQAVGRDARGRKQYRYHPLYRQIRDMTKFSRMISFAGALPSIRERVEKDLSLPGLPKEKVLASAVRLLETTAIRVGNDQYAKSNDSYGLTTLKEEHLTISGRVLRFHFRGKSGLEHDLELTDRKLAGILSRCQCIDGEELFHFLDENDTVCRIHSEDVNAYLREITGEHFTAKDFRTWVGSGQAVLALEELGPSESEADAKKKIVAAVKKTARKLGNRPATCRKYYVHPAILDSYEQGMLLEALGTSAEAGALAALRREEHCVLTVLKAAGSSTCERAA
jgi:DNA topoisomerase-1